MVIGLRERKTPVCQGMRRERGSRYRPQAGQDGVGARYEAVSGVEKVSRGKGRKVRNFLLIFLNWCETEHRGIC